MLVVNRIIIFSADILVKKLQILFIRFNKLCFFLCLWLNHARAKHAPSLSLPPTFYSICCLLSEFRFFFNICQTHGLSIVAVSPVVHCGANARFHYLSRRCKITDSRRLQTENTECRYWRGVWHFLVLLLLFSHSSTANNPIHTGYILRGSLHLYFKISSFIRHPQRGGFEYTPQSVSH